MTDEEIEAYRKQLNDLTAQCFDKIAEQKIKPERIELARKVGASACVFWD